MSSVLVLSAKIVIILTKDYTLMIMLLVYMKTILIKSDPPYHFMELSHWFNYVFYVHVVTGIASEQPAMWYRRYSYWTLFGMS